jgi:hypothetical protein
MTGPAIDACAALTVAIKTPSHLHGRCSLYYLHLRNLTVAFLTGNACFYVALMIEAYMIRHYVYLLPRNRLIVVPILLQLGQRL